MLYGHSGVRESVDEAEGHGVSVELTTVGGGGRLDHADEGHDIEGDVEEETGAAGDDSDWDENDGEYEEGYLEVEGFSAVIIEEW